MSAVLRGEHIQSDARDLELTILMPCLNEAETIETCIQKATGYLRSSGVVGEVLIADNGSTDGSVEMAQRLGARVVKVRERGYGAALIAGIEAARGRYVIMGDADDSYEFSNLEGFVSALRGGNELVMGNRFKGGIKPGAMPPLHRYLGNPVLSTIGRVFFNSPVGDFHCGLRGFNREAIAGLGLCSPGMEFASEMVVKATLKKLKITEVPTTLSPDGRSRPPHLRSWRDGWRHLRFLMLFSPRWLFLYPGIVLSLLGLASMVLVAARPAHDRRCHSRHQHAGVCLRSDDLWCSIHGFLVVRHGVRGGRGSPARIEIGASLRGYGHIRVWHGARRCAAPAGARCGRIRRWHLGTRFLRWARSHDVDAHRASCGDSFGIGRTVRVL